MRDLISLFMHLWDRWRFEATPAERAWDAERGVETSTWTIGGYEPTPLTLAHTILGAVPRRGRTFVDVGCGKGRMLLLAREAGFERAIGVELDSTLFETARANLEGCEGLSVINRDARLFPWPSTPLVVFLYNPFEEPIVGQVVDRLERSLRDAPRPVDLIYVNPLWAEAFETRGWQVLSDTGVGTSRWLHLQPPSFLGQPLRPPALRPER